MKISDLPSKNKIIFVIIMGVVTIAGLLPVFIAVKLGLASFLQAVIIYSVFFFLSILAASFYYIGKDEPNNNLSEIKNLSLELLGDGVFLFDIDGEPEFISNSLAKLFSCQKFELTGTGLFDRTHIMDRPLYLRAVSLTRMECKKQNITIRMRKDNMAVKQSFAEYIWVEISLMPIVQSDKKSAPYAIAAMFKDVSQQKSEMEELLKNKRCEKTDLETKTQFLAMIGHELRTPLNAIVGFSDMMVNQIGGELKSTHLEYARNISQSGYHLLDVVNGLLDMSKIEAGKFELNSKRFDLSSIVEPSIKIVSKQAQDKKIKIKMEIGKNLPLIEADERACRQILINLLSNAIKFSQNGAQVICSIKRQGNSLVFGVSDEGIGMSKEHVSRFGEPFLQANVGFKREYEGVGLGISIVKGLVDLHHGRLIVKSKMGVGTIISVILPVSEPAIEIDDKTEVLQKNILRNDIKHLDVLEKEKSIQYQRRAV